LEALNTAERYGEGEFVEVKLPPLSPPYTQYADIAVHYAIQNYKTSISKYKCVAMTAYFADKVVYQGHWASQSPEWAWQKKLLRHMFKRR
jgi:hypothetical protein